MLDRGQESQNLAYAEDTSTAFMAYSPLAQGMLTGKIGPDRIFSDGDQRNTKSRFSVENRKRVGELLEIFSPVADKHDATLGQLVIAWTISQRGCSHALVGARTVSQVLENAKGGSIALDYEDLKIINGALKEFEERIV
jgi:aryl-alcohol dehydrogenase-like predicted oxidoreductase